jgi:hypothetical protein
MDPHGPEAQLLGWELFVAKETGKFLAQIQSCDRSGTRTQFSCNVSSLVDLHWQGNVSAFSRFLGIHYSTAQFWIASRQRPSLGSLLLIAYRFQVSIENLLFGDIRRCSLPDPKRSATNILAPSKRKLRRHDLAVIERMLQDAVNDSGCPPPSLREICLRIGRSQSYAMHKFRPLASEIALRYDSQRKIGAQKRLDFIRSQVNSAVRQIDASGLYPSLNRVGKLLPERVSLRDRVAKVEWRRATRELGWVNGEDARGAWSGDP